MYLLGNQYSSNLDTLKGVFTRIWSLEDYENQEDVQKIVQKIIKNNYLRSYIKLQRVRDQAPKRAKKRVAETISTMTKPNQSSALVEKFISKDTPVEEKSKKKNH